MQEHAPQNMNSERYHIRNAAAPFLTGLCPKVARLLVRRGSAALCSWICGIRILVPPFSWTLNPD